MKTLLALLLLTLVSSSALADDLVDAKAAFATLIQYQKTDDERSPDLFSKDCVITYTRSDGTNEKTTEVPTEVFINGMKKAIAQKKGSQEIHENVKYAQEAGGIRVTADVRRPTPSGSGLLSVLYRRDSDGVLRIHDFRATMYVNK